MKKLLIGMLILAMSGLMGCKKMSVDEINQKLEDGKETTTEDVKDVEDPYTVEITSNDYTSDKAYKIDGTVTANTKNSGFTTIEIELLNDAGEVVDVARINVGALSVGETKEFSGSGTGEGISSYGEIKVTGY